MSALTPMKVSNKSSTPDNVSAVTGKAALTPVKVSDKSFTSENVSAATGSALTPMKVSDKSSTSENVSAATESAKKKRLNVSLAQSFNDILQNNGKNVFLNQSLQPDDQIFRTDPVDACTSLESIIMQKIAAFKSELSDSFQFLSVVVGKSGSDIGDVSQLAEKQFTQKGKCKSIYGRWKGYRTSHIARTTTALPPEEDEEDYDAKLKVYKSQLRKNKKENKRANDNTPPPVCMIVIATMGPQSMPDRFRATGLQHEDYGELIESILQALLKKKGLHHLMAGLGGGGQRCLAKFIVIYICIYATDLRPPNADDSSSTDNLTNVFGEDEVEDEDEECDDNDDVQEDIEE